MFRVRRYRVFIFAAALILGCVYYFGPGLATGESLLGSSKPPSLKDFRFDGTGENPTTPLKPVIDDAFWDKEFKEIAEEHAKETKLQEAHAQEEFPQIELLGAGNKIRTTQSTTTPAGAEVTVC